MKADDKAGDVRTWTAIDADSKLMVSWLVGDRGVRAAAEFMNDVAARLANRIQLTTDGHKVYINAMDSAFSEHVNCDARQTVRKPDQQPL
jgi:transposase-like protein